MEPTRSLLVRVAFLLAGAAILASASVAATRPDDRAGPLGAGVQAVSPAAAHPDSRAGVRGVGAQVPSPAAAHPDSRAGVRGVTPVAVASDGTDWRTIGIGVGAGAAALLLVVAAALAMRHGGHRPHRPILGH